MVLFIKCSATAFFFFFKGTGQQESGDKTSENDMIVFYFDDSNKEAPRHSALCKNRSSIMSSHQREGTKPQAPTGHLLATILGLPQLCPEPLANTMNSPSHRILSSLLPSLSRLQEYSRRITMSKTRTVLTSISLLACAG